MAEKRGRFGIHGGQYIPETLMNAVTELEEAYEHYKNVAEQLRLVDDVELHEYAGNTVIVLVGNVTQVNIGAINYARSIGDYVIAMHV